MTASRPSALLVEKDTFADYKLEINDKNQHPLSREEAIEVILNNLNDSDVIVAGIGKMSREIFRIQNP